MDEKERYWDEVERKAARNARNMKVAISLLIATLVIVVVVLENLT